MSEKKFIDLGPQIAEGTGYDPGSRGHLAQLSTLHWLDAHPEADPANEEHEEFVNDICALLPERYDDDVAAEAIVLWAVRDLVARAEAQLTITESELETIASDLATYEGAVWKNRIRKHLAHIGVRVVPDREPTNAEHDCEWWIENANTSDAEDCEACGETDNQCPVHYGIAVGIDLIVRKIAALGDDPELFARIPDQVTAPGGEE